MRKPDTLVAGFPDLYKLMKQDEVSKTCSFPKSYVSYRRPGAVGTEQGERARQMMIAKNKAKEVYAEFNGIVRAFMVEWQHRAI